MMSVYSFLCMDFGVAFPAIVSICILIALLIVLFFLWWTDKKKRTVKSLFTSMKNGFFKTGEAVTDFLTNSKVKTVYSKKSLNYSGTEFLPIPSKEPNDKFTYEFVGWEKCGIDENGSPIVRAIFLQHTQKIYVNVYDEDKTTLIKSFEIEFGAGIDLSDVNLTKPDTNEFSYQFVGWDKDVKAFYKNENVYAVYKAIPKKFTYTFFDYDGESIVAQGTALYGTPITLPPTPVRQNENGQVFKFVGWKNFTDGILTKNCSFVAEFQSVPETSVLGSTVVDINGNQVKVESVQVSANSAEKPKKIKKLISNISEKPTAAKLDFVDELNKKKTEQENHKKETYVPKKKKEKKSTYKVLSEGEKEHSEPMLFGINMAELKTDSASSAQPIVSTRIMKTVKASKLEEETKKPAPAEPVITSVKDDEDMKDITPLTAQKTENITNSLKKKEIEKSPLDGIMFNHVKISKKNKK